ncbi:Vms1/Ankzf1 family peptidyl-tRNA hydrolase [Microbacterium sp. NPDC096154]|uniref:baeRF2 domain-containing protein n=1 Tax=Microbacterium sp. NPDC096154 TaxID=3155549 RepID=UPI00333219C1
MPDTIPDTGHDLAALLNRPGPWTTVYTDGHGARPQAEEEARRRAVTDPLRDAGAPEEDVAAVAAALDGGEGLPSPSVRILWVQHGEVALDESFVGSRLGPEHLAHGPVPPILPLLRHRTGVVPYLLVETAREGARLSLREANRGGDGETSEIEGRTDSLNKVQAGGWSHRRYQQHSQEIWEQNQAEVAEAVDRIVREQRPRFVVVAGDVRARQLLLERLATASRDLVLEVEVHTKAEGSDDAALERAVAEAVDSGLDGAIQRTRDRAAENHGAAGARGVGEVIDALQQARVDTLLLDARFVQEGDDGESLAALANEPWVARGELNDLPAESLGYVPAAEALARAAVLSGARVLVVEEELEDGEARDGRPAAEPVAALRWAEGG